MPYKQHHEVLVFKKTVWLSLSFDLPQDSKHWRIYRRWGRKGKGEWWWGLVPKGYMDMKNEDLPKPILKAYAFTEWTWETPQRPNGTDLWVADKTSNKCDIWYSTLNWDKVLVADDDEWEHVGAGYYP